MAVSTKGFITEAASVILSVSGIALFCFAFHDLQSYPGNVNLNSRGHTFRGYYCPKPLVSKLKDELVYTPVGKGKILRNCGFETNLLTGEKKFNEGTEFEAKMNDKVFCLLPGRVNKVGWDDRLGRFVEIYHPYPNIFTRVGHLNGYAVLEGMWAERGRVIGYAGLTGQVETFTDACLNYSVRNKKTNEYIETMDFFKLIPKYVEALQIARSHLKEQKESEP